MQRTATDDDLTLGLPPAAAEAPRGIFALGGRVRPYNKYLAWELRTHPLAVAEWQSDTLIPQLERILVGDADARRAAFTVLERECRRFDTQRGTATRGGTIDDGPRSSRSCAGRPRPDAPP